MILGCDPLLSLGHRYQGNGKLHVCGGLIPVSWNREPREGDLVLSEFKRQFLRSDGMLEQRCLAGHKVFQGLLLAC